MKYTFKLITQDILHIIRTVLPYSLILIFAAPFILSFLCSSRSIDDFWMTNNPFRAVSHYDFTSFFEFKFMTDIIIPIFLFSAAVTAGAYLLFRLIGSAFENSKCAFLPLIALCFPAPFYISLFSQLQQPRFFLIIVFFQIVRLTALLFLLRSIFTLKHTAALVTLFSLIYTEFSISEFALSGFAIESYPSEQFTLSAFKYDVSLFFQPFLFSLIMLLFLKLCAKLLLSFKSINN